MSKPTARGQNLMEKETEEDPGTTAIIAGEKVDGESRRKIKGASVLQHLLRWYLRSYVKWVYIMLRPEAILAMHERR